MDGSSCLHEERRFMDNSLCLSNYFHIQCRFGAPGPSSKGTQWAQAAWPLLHAACCQRARSGSVQRGNPLHQEHSHYFPFQVCWCSYTSHWKQQQQQQQQQHRKQKNNYHNFVTTSLFGGAKYSVQSMLQLAFFPLSKSSISREVNWILYDDQ